MFLDDRLLRIDREVELTDDGVLEGVSLMLGACFDNLSERTKGQTDLSVIQSNFRRVYNTLELVRIYKTFGWDNDLMIYYGY